jgi:hypothetical protein
MTHSSQDPDAPRGEPAFGGWPVPPGPAAAADAGEGLRRRLLALLTAAAGSALLGLLAGLVWSVLAPRPLLVVQSPGVAEVINPETNAFIAADAWFCLVTAVGGLICGVAGYLLSVRRHGAAALAGLLLGGVAAAALTMWVGQQQGLSAFQSRLAASRAGTLLHEPLALGGHGELAFWPLAVALVVGAVELVSQAIERRPGYAGT